MTRANATAIALAVAASTVAWAGRTQTWSENAETLARGRAEGLALRPQGELSLAPRLVRLGGGDALPGGALHAWCAAAQGERDLLVGTGPGGGVLRLGPTGRAELLATLSEPMVTAVAPLADGSSLAASAPGGTIYRIDRGAAASPWAETGSRYVWALAAGGDGVVYAATGEPGRVVRVRAGGVEPVFDCDEPHVVALSRAADGAWLAGGAGAGRVYRIDGRRSSSVLYDDELTEVVDLVEDADGSVVVALAAAPAPEAKRPAVRIELPQTATPGTPSGGGVPVLEDPTTAPIVRGVIEGLSGPEERAGARQTGRVVRIAKDGHSSTLWRSTAEVPLALARDGTGRIVFGTGEPARLWQVEPGDAGVTLLASLDEAQVSALAATRNSFAVATSNPPAVYRLSAEPAESGTFVSRPIDAGAQSRWGLVRWSVAGGTPRVEISTRTGGSAQPDATWSDWTGVPGVPRGGPIASPDGRYLQWRARITGPAVEAERLWGIQVTFEPRNRPPVLREFYLDGPGGAVSGDAVFRWSVNDPDQDATEIEVEIRPAGSDEWTRVPGPDADPARAEWRDDRLILHTAGLDEGEYAVRVAVNDQAGNPPGEALRVADAAPRSVTVDRTPPRIEMRPLEGGEYELEVTDEHSALQRVEVVSAGRVAFSLRPTDGMCDSRRETLHFVPPAQLSLASAVVRAVDAAGNKMEAPLSRR